MLKLKDLPVTKELETKEMSSVVGGHWLPLFDGSTTMKSKVADVDQLFEFAFNQANAGAVTNNQEIIGGNGLSFAPVHQNLSQGNSMSVYDIGNTNVS